MTDSLRDAIHKALIEECHERCLNCDTDADLAAAAARKWIADKAEAVSNERPPVWLDADAAYGWGCGVSALADALTKEGNDG